MTSAATVPALRVFPDTGALLAMVVFPRDKQGNLTLAGEVLSLLRQGAFRLVVSRAVVDELEEVIDRDFASQRLRAMALLALMAEEFTRWPTPHEIAVALPFATDTEDAPIFAAAIAAEPDIVLSNDFRAFHTPRAKGFWAVHGIEVESLYGLLCVFGKRERRTEVG